MPTEYFGKGGTEAEGKNRLIGHSQSQCALTVTTSLNMATVLKAPSLTVIIQTIHRYKTLLPFPMSYTHEVKKKWNKLLAIAMSNIDRLTTANNKSRLTTHLSPGC